MEEKMTEAPAILIFKETKEIIDNLTEEETGKLFKAVFDYSDTKTVPVLPRDLYIAFLIIKSKIDASEERYQRKLTYNKERQRERRAREKAEETGGNEPEEPKKPKHKKKQEESPPGANQPNKAKNDGIDNYEQANFLFTIQEKYPEKKINCKMNEFPGVNYASVLYEIEKSEFLKKDPGVTLKWLLMNASKICAGRYRTEKSTKQIKADNLSKRASKTNLNKFVELDDLKEFEE